MQSSRQYPRRVLLVATLAALPLLAQTTAYPPAEKREGQFTHQLLAPGIAASAPFPIALRTLPARMVLRHFAIGHGQAKDVPNPSFAVMELNAGNVFTTIAGDRKERVPGDIWTVEKGTSISFENPQHAAAAIIRVIYFEPVR
jgi:hypothetical protein